MSLFYCSFIADVQTLYNIFAFILVSLKSCGPLYHSVAVILSNLMKGWLSLMHSFLVSFANSTTDHILM